jgi:hypothetical protein
VRAARFTPAALAALLVAAGTPATAQPLVQPPWTPDPVVGVWIAEVTQRDCASGTPIVTFRGMSVLHHGGTLSETNESPPTSRGPAWGRWVREGEQYSARFRFARYAPDGTLVGYTRVQRHFTMAADGQTLNGSARFEIQDPAGNTFAVGCATDITRRLP